MEVLLSFYKSRVGGRTSFLTLKNWERLTSHPFGAGRATPREKVREGNLFKYSDLKQDINTEESPGKPVRSPIRRVGALRT